MKRLISILLSVFILISVVPGAIAADASKNTQRREILGSLGIMSIDSNSEFVTRKEFFNGLLYMIYDEFDEEKAKELLIARGLLFNDSDELFAEERSITYNDAVASVVTILGYDQVAMVNGAYPTGYERVARDIGLLSGVAGSRTVSLRRDSLVNLFYNALSVEPCVVSFVDNEIAVEFAYGNSILSIERDIYEISGIVEANQYTSIFGLEGNKEDKVTINGRKYYINGTNAGDLIGCSVKGYVQLDEEDDGKVIYLSAERGRTTEIIIDAEDVVSVSEDCRKIEYLREDGRTARPLDISTAVKVIYNGKFYDKYTNADFIFEKGSLRLIDNNGDDVYDSIFVEAYETMVVEYTTYNNEIYGKYTYKGALNYLALEEKDDNENIHYYLGNDEVDFSKISKDDVLTIQRSKGDSDIVANIYISRNSITGNAEAIDDEEGIVRINGEEYSVSEAFYKESVASGRINISDSYTFYFDYFGELAYVKRPTSSDYSLFYKIFEDESGEAEYQMKYLNENSEWITAPVAEKVRYNGDTCAAKVLYSELELFQPQVMLIRQNTAGEVKYVTTASVGKKGEKALAKTAETKMNYHSVPMAFNYSLYLDKDNTKVFVIPASQGASREDYYVTDKSYFYSDKDYTITAYDVDEFNFTSVLSVSESKENKNIKLDKAMLVVTDVYEALDEDDITATYVNCSKGLYHNLEYKVDETANPGGIEKGSVIRIHLDRTGNVIDQWEDVKDNQNSLTASMRDDRYFYGKILANDYAEGKFKIECNEVVGYFRHNDSATFLIYDTVEKECTVGSAKDLVVGDNVYITTYFGRPDAFVIVR